MPRHVVTLHLVLLVASSLVACGGTSAASQGRSTTERTSSPWTVEDRAVFAEMARPGAPADSVDPAHLTIADVRRLGSALRAMRTSPHPDFLHERRALLLYVLGPDVHLTMCMDAMAALHLPSNADEPYTVEYLLQLAGSLFESIGTGVTVEESYVHATSAIVDYYRAALLRGASHYDALDALIHMADQGTLEDHVAALVHGCPPLGIVDGVTR